MLTNTTAIKSVVDTWTNKFDQMFKRKTFLHWFER